MLLLEVLNQLIFLVLVLHCYRLDALDLCGFEWIALDRLKQHSIPSTETCADEANRKVEIDSS